jgi:S-adenosylmethionine:tRNA ribosyltransferase-isomerase
MRAAPGPIRARLLVADPDSGGMRLGALEEVLGAGDVVVVNDAATLPASLRGATAAGDPIELRLATPPESGWAVVMGAGDWRTDTDHRPAPPILSVDDTIHFASLTARVAAVSAQAPRLVQVRFDREGAALWHALYAVGEPVRYRYLDRPWPLERFQNVYAGRPWAAEMPSAGRALDHRTILALQRKGVQVHALTHAAGLSATGDPALDRMLPLPEQYEVPEDTLRAVSHARRVVAVGTSVVRALESAARGPHSGITSLRIGPDTELLAVDGVLTNLHGPGESHFELLEAVADGDFLARAWQAADRLGLQEHEFGDEMLVLPGALARMASRRPVERTAA